MFPRGTISSEQYPKTHGGHFSSLQDTDLIPVPAIRGLPEVPHMALLLRHRGHTGKAPSTVPCPQLHPLGLRLHLPTGEGNYLRRATRTWGLRREAPGAPKLSSTPGPTVDSGHRPRAKHCTAHLQVCHNLLHLGPADVQETLNQVSIDEARGWFCLSFSMKRSPGGQVSQGMCDICKQPYSRSPHLCTDHSLKQSSG